MSEKSDMSDDTFHVVGGGQTRFLLPCLCRETSEKNIFSLLLQLSFLLFILRRLMIFRQLLYNRTDDKIINGVTAELKTVSADEPVGPVSVRRKKVGRAASP